MEANPTLLQGLGQMGVNGWTAHWDPELEITVQVSASSEDVVGHKVGLTQTILEDSSRVVTYQGGGTLTIKPTAGPPCLDSDDSLIPWYNGDSRGRALNPIGKDPISLTLRDTPAVNVPSFALNPEGKHSQPISLAAAEQFLVTLYDSTAEPPNQVIKQWTWGYKYLLERPEGGGRVKITDAEQFPISDLGTSFRTPTLSGPVAGEAPRQDWSEGWGPYLG